MQIPPHLQRCADGATTFSSTQHLLSGDVTPPEEQRSPSADQGLPQRTSGTPYEPVCADPNPAALIAFLRASPLLCSPRCLRAAVAAPRAAFGALVRPSSPSCGPRRLCAALAASVRPLPPLVGPSAPLCGPRRLFAGLATFVQPSLPPCGRCRPSGGLRRLHAVLAAFMRSFHLTFTHWPWPSVSCRGRFSRPSSQDAGRSFSPACTLVKMQTGRGSCGGSYSC
jgi:hypothetical protein